jgi:hypothetical protein
VGGRRSESNAGLVAGAREVIERQVRREVHEGAGHGGDRDAAMDRAVGSFDAPAPHRDAVDAPLERRRDLRLCDRPLEHTEQVRRRPPAQARVLAAASTAAR